jgi:arsenate reductase
MPRTGPLARHQKTRAIVEVQIFGTNKNQDTRKALRFFSERRIKVHFVDLKERAASRGELTRFVQKFGITALIDKTSSRYAELGLGASRYGDDRWLDQLCDEPLLLTQPLTRFGPRLTIGLAEVQWKKWIDEAKAR